MRKLLLLCLGFLALPASPALAAGINLSFDDCGTFGTETRTFACDTNAGTNVMVGSFVAPGLMTEYGGCESEIEIQTDSATLPEWWKFRNSGACRQTSLTLSGDFTAGPYNCVDFFAGNAGSAIRAYEVAYHGLNRARILLLLVVTNGNRDALVEGVEYYAYKLSFNNLSSTGTGSCAGCATGACINIGYMKLLQAPFLNDNRVLTNPANRAHVRWQTATDASCIGATPTRATTWGALKAFYR